MFAYCNNNPVMYSDPTGEFLFAALATAVIVAFTLSGCTSVNPEPYKSADDAAKAFSENTYGSSSYIRHEYSTEIYSRTVNGETTYNYVTPHAGKPHYTYVSGSVPDGTTIVAYAHTHPNSNSFSKADIDISKGMNINAYVVGPNLILQRYEVATSSTTSIGTISPIELTDAQRQSLVNEFRVSWDAHITEGCDFGCDSMIWPTP